MQEMFFDGDIYADDDSVCRGLSFAQFDAPSILRFSGVDSWGVTLEDAAKEDALTPSDFGSVSGNPLTVYSQRRVEQLRARFVELLGLEGECCVRLSEKAGVLKAKVQLFVDSAQTVVSLTIRTSAVQGGSKAEWTRGRGDSVVFHRLFRAVTAEAGEDSAERQLEGALDLLCPKTSLPDAFEGAQSVPEETVASLARYINTLSSDEVASLPRFATDVLTWLESTDVMIVGPACSIAKRLCAVDERKAETFLATAVQQAELAAADENHLLRARLLLRLSSQLC